MGGDARRFDRLFPLLYAVVYAAAALAVQLAWFPVGDLGTESDFYGDLVIAAQRLWQGEFSVSYYPFKGPLTSFALVGVHAVVSLLGGDWYRSGVTLNLICAASVLILLYRLLLRTFNRRVAVCATIGVSLAFEFFLHAHKATSDLLFLLLCYLAFERLTKRGWSLTRLAAAGALGGLAFLTRYNGLIVPLAGVLVVLMVNRERQVWRRRLLGAVVHVAAFAVVVAPWYAVNHAQTGRLLATHNLQNIFVEEFYGVASTDPAPDDRPDSLGGVIRRDPLLFLQRYLSNVPDHLLRELNDSLNNHVTVLLVLGLLRMLLFPPRRRHWALLVFPLVYFLAMCSVYYQPRFAFAVWPGWFAVGFTALAGDGVDRRGRLGDLVARVFAVPLTFLRERASHAGVIILAVAALTMYGFQISDLVVAEKAYRQRLPLFVLDIAPELKRLAGNDTDAFVMARKPHLAHYAGLGYMQYPHTLTDAADFLAFAVANDVRLIVYGDVERDYYPEHLYLGGLARYTGIERAFADGATVIYELARELTADAIVVSDVTADLSRRLVAARADGNATLTFQLCALIAEDRALDREWTAAAAYLEEGLSVMPRGESPAAQRAVTNAKLNLAQSYIRLERWVDGIALLEPALSEIGELLPPDRQATAHACLALHLEHDGRTAAALRYLARARDLYQAAGDTQSAENMRRRMEQLR